MDEVAEPFEYVVERKPPARCCFGSTVRRDTCPIGKGLSPFQKRRTAENFISVGPGSYDNVDRYTSLLKTNFHRITSTKGYGSMANAAPRYKDEKKLITPAPFKYAPSLTWDVPKESNFPFGSRTIRKMVPDNFLPSPGTYDIATKTCRRTRFQYNFGHPTMVDTVDMFCTYQPGDICLKCKALCDGDYWQRDHSSYLCHLCWLEEKYTQEIFSRKKLKQFKKLRNCSFLHEHEGTTAAIQLIPKNKLKKKIRLENYLDLYLKC